MSAEFEQFARAAQQPRSDLRAAPPVFDRIAVLGGGADARLIAALSLSEGCDVTLFSAYGRELELLRASSGIGLRGDGPIGTYHVDRDGPSVTLTAELDAAVANAEVIFLTGPVHKQRTYGMVLADHLRDGQVIVVAPARTFGALETMWHLRLGGCQADVTVVETQGLPFWFQAEGAVLTLSQAGPAATACLPRDRTDVLARLRGVLPNLRPVETVLASSFCDLSAAVEIPALVLRGAGLEPGGVHVPLGGVPLAKNDTFASLIGPDQRRLVDQLAAERREVARAFGVRDLPQTQDWRDAISGAPGARPVPDRDAARVLLRDGVVASLVPLVSAAELAGIGVPQTRAMIALAGALLGADVAASGRRLAAMGLNEATPDSIRRRVDTVTSGGQ